MKRIRPAIIKPQSVQQAHNVGCWFAGLKGETPMRYNYWRTTKEIDGRMFVKIEREEDREDGKRETVTEFADIGHVRYCGKPMPLAIDGERSIYTLTVEKYPVGKSEGEAIVLEATDGQKYHLANPEEWDAGADLFLMQFGMISCTQVAVWTCGFEDALEIGAGYLADRGWKGHFSEPDYADARKEIAEERGCKPEDIEDCDSDLIQNAEADLTYTESGWLHSDEWYGHEAPKELRKTCELIGQIIEAEEA